MALTELMNDVMMCHLMQCLEQHRRVGHYGRLVFAMVARHFGDEEEVVALLAKDPDCNLAEATALYHQVVSHDYSPPTRERIAEWQKLQQQVICPGIDDPDAGNVYKDLHFPEGVYEHIREYHEKKAESEAAPIVAPCTKTKKTRKRRKTSATTEGIQTDLNLLQH